MEEEVLDKYKVDDSKREANKGRGAEQESGEKIAGQESSFCSESTYNLQRLQSNQGSAGGTDEAEAKDEDF